MTTREQSGFTLYELLVTLLVIGVVLVIGIPNLSDFTRNSRVTGTANDLHGSIMLGRSEAARSKENVTICASADPTGAAQCDGGSFDEGWIVFVDRDGDIVRDPDADPTLDESVLKSFTRVHELVDIDTGGATYFSFAPTGLGRTGPGGPPIDIAYICDDRGNEIAGGGLSSARALVVTPIGRSTVVRDKDQIDALAGVACD